MADHPGFAHAMAVETRKIDGFPVVFHYGQVRPGFESFARTPQRERRTLADGWKFRFDPTDRGQSDRWFSPEISGDDWTAVSVPHCWDMMPGGRFHDWKDSSPANPPHYNGAAWYRLQFEFNPSPGKRQRLEFLGVSQRARVFLNGSQVAMHEGGGQPFSIDVTDTLRAGPNLLALKVVRRSNYDTSGQGEPVEITQIHSPHPKAPDNWPYAGIIRDVTLIEESPVTLRKVQLVSRKDTLEAAVIVTNHGDQPASVMVGLAGPALTNTPPPRNLTLKPGEVRVLRFDAELKSSAGRWSPSDPKLHPLTVAIESEGERLDTWSGRFGIRDFGIRDSRFTLNDRPVFLKGVAMYEETENRGAALLASDHRRLFQLTKETGANFIRLHVTQRAPLAYDLADQLGFMVSGEWGGFWYREQAMAAQTADDRSIYQSLARCALWDLMNHPSVVLWASHNESHQFCPEYESFVAKGTALVRELDPQQRPVTWAAWHPHMGQPHFEHADAVGFNEYRGAMDPFENLEPDLLKAASENPGKPLLILENGAWAAPGNHGPKDRKGTEEWQADLLRRQHAVLTRHIPPLAGYTYWLLVDYRSRKPYTAKPGGGGYSAMGIYSPAGEPKLVRDVFRDLKW